PEDYVLRSFPDNYERKKIITKLRERAGWMQDAAKAKVKKMEGLPKDWEKWAEQVQQWIQRVKEVKAKLEAAEGKLTVKRLCEDFDELRRDTEQLFAWIKNTLPQLYVQKGETDFVRFDACAQITAAMYPQEYQKKIEDANAENEGQEGLEEASEVAGDSDAGDQEEERTTPRPDGDDSDD
ncbi:hypothetical protein IL306_009492, partial [Fusarium sp. DS 682]